MCALVAYGVGDVLYRDAVGTHDRDGRVPSFVRVPVAEAGPPGDFAEAPVERVLGVRPSVLVAEHEVVFLPERAAERAGARTARTCRNEGIVRAHAYALARIVTHCSARGDSSTTI